MNFLLFIFVLNVFAKIDYDDWKNPQIITGPSNIYLEDLPQRQVVNGKWKGIYVQFQTTKQIGYHFYGLSRNDQDEVIQIEGILQEINAEGEFSAVTHPIPGEIVFKAGTQRTFFVGVPESHNHDVAIVAEKMLQSEEEANPIVIREEFFPLNILVAIDETTKPLYYKVIGRTHWKVTIHVDDEEYATHDVRKGEEKVVSVEIKEQGIHTILFTYAEDVSEEQEIHLDQQQPVVLNAVFRNTAVRETHACVEGEQVLVRYVGKADGYITINDRTTTFTHTKYIHNNDKCYTITEGQKYEIHGDYEIILGSLSFVTQDTYVIITVGFEPKESGDQSSETKEVSEHSSQVEPEQKDEGLSDNAIVAISVVCSIVGVLLLVSVVVLIIIIVTKKSKGKSDYTQLNLKKTF